MLSATRMTVIRSFLRIFYIRCLLHFGEQVRIITLYAWSDMTKSTGLSDGTENTAESKAVRTIRSLAIHVLREYVFSPAAGVRDFEPDLEGKNERSGRSNH